LFIDRKPDGRHVGGMILRLILLLVVLFGLLPGGGAQAHEPVTQTRAAPVIVLSDIQPVLEPLATEAGGYVIERCRRPHPAVALNGPVGCGSPVAMVQEVASVLAIWPVQRLALPAPPDMAGRDPAPDRRPTRHAA
jgi:hypothetical protein